MASFEEFAIEGAWVNEDGRKMRANRHRRNLRLPSECLPSSSAYNPRKNPAQSARPMVTDCAGAATNGRQGSSAAMLLRFAHFV
jgi:hypothetical protein